MSLSVISRGGGTGGASALLTVTAPTGSEVTAKLGNKVLTSKEESILIKNPRRLPDEYQEVEYIQSSGTQYIDSGIKPSEYNGTLKSVVDIQFTKVDSTDQSFGVTGNPYVFPVRISSNGNFYIQSGGGGTEVSFGTADTSRHLWTMDQIAAQGSIDDTTKSLTINGNRGYNIYLFAVNNADAAKQYCYSKLYSAKFYSSDELIRDYVPCYIKSTGEAGLYDLVSETFFGNNGTGAFSVGDALIPHGLPDEYQELTYIQSTGTQYINTGLQVFSGNSFTIELDVEPTSFYNYNTLWGSTYDADTFESWIYSTGEIAFRYNSTRSSDTTISLSRMTVRYVMNNGALELYINDSLIGSGTATVKQVTNPLLLLLSGTDYGKAKLYKVTVESPSITRREIYPAKRISDGAIGMYDVVGGTFFANSGSGTFACGAEVFSYDDIQFTGWKFNLRSYGTWTVEATLDGESASGTVEVDEATEYNVNMQFDLYIFDYRNGGLQVEMTYTSGSYDSYLPTITNTYIVGKQTNSTGGWNVYYPKEAIDVSKYAYVYAEILSGNTSFNQMRIMGPSVRPEIYEDYTGVYVDNIYTTTGSDTGLGPKMTDSYIRLVKYTNHLPEGAIYLQNE